MSETNKQLKLELGIDDKFYRLELLEDEPVFPLRGKDELTLQVLACYLGFCIAHGLNDQAQKTRAFMRYVATWQHEHSELVGAPD